MKIIFALFTISALIGMSIAIGYFYFYLTKQILFDFIELLKAIGDYIWSKLKFVGQLVIGYIKTREFRKWKKEKLPGLVIKSRHGDPTALAERIARSKHKGLRSGEDGKYEY